MGVDHDSHAPSSQPGLAHASRDFEALLDRPEGVSFWSGAQQYRVRKAAAHSGNAKDEEPASAAEVRAVIDRAAHAGDPTVPIAILQRATTTKATLVVLRLRPKPSGGGSNSAPAPGPAPPPAKPPKPIKEGWIEIEVVDDAGKPVSGRGYKLKLPDGRTLEGKLGSNGLISVHGIDPGSATLSLVDLDGKAWSEG